LFSRDPRQLAGRHHFAAQPLGGDVEAVRPSWCTEFEKNAGEISLVPERLEHGARLDGHCSKVVHAFAAVIEAYAQPKAAKLFQVRYLSQHRDLRSSRVARLRGRDASSRAIGAGAPAPTPSQAVRLLLATLLQSPHLYRSRRSPHARRTPLESAVVDDPARTSG